MWFPGCPHDGCLWLETTGGRAGTSTPVYPRAFVTGAAERSCGERRSVSSMFRPCPRAVAGTVRMMLRLMAPFRPRELPGILCRAFSGRTPRSPRLSRTSDHSGIASQPVHSPGHCALESGITAGCWGKTGRCPAACGSATGSWQELFWQELSWPWPAFPARDRHADGCRWSRLIHARATRRLWRGRRHCGAFPGPATVPPPAGDRPT